MSEWLEEDGLLPALLVVELGERVGVGACGGLLAGLGAEVVLVEPPVPSNSEKWRDRAALAAGKRSVVIDRGTEEGRADLRRLLDRADVVLLSTDLCAGDRAVWDGERSRGQILCDITAFGHEGPLAGRPASEPLVQAWSAVADTMGDRDGPPTPTGAPLLDMSGAAYAASAILAALRVRRLHGFGQRIDVALYDVGVNALATFIPLDLIGRPSSRMGNRHPTLSPWNAYRASDGWVTVCAPTNDQWRRLCTAMGRPELVADPRYAGTTARMDNVAEIDAIVGAWTASLTVEDCVARLSAQTIPSGRIVELDRLAAEPNLAHRGVVRCLSDPESGAMVRVPASPLRISGRKPTGPAGIPRRDADRAVLEVLAAAANGRVTGDTPFAMRPLAGVRVVEIGMNTVAPLACRQLGALGADVVKVEPPSGDSNRINAPLREDGESYIFAISNTDKRGLVLNLRQEADKDILWRLLATADLVIENLKPGSLDRLGLGAKEVLGRFPRLVYCSVNGFGYDSVYPGRPALDTVIQGMSGMMDASPVEGVPTKAGISISDQLGGQFGLLGMLAALDHRDRTGRGLHLDLAMQDVSAWATHTLWNRREKVGSRARILAAADGHVAVEGSDAALAAALGLAETGGPAVAGAIGTLSRSDLIARLEGRPGCAAAPVLTVGEVMEHPQTAARGLLVERPTADGSSWLVLGSPLRLRSTPAEVRSAMPRLGFLDPTLADELGLRPMAKAS